MKFVWKPEETGIQVWLCVWYKLILINTIDKKGWVINEKRNINRVFREQEDMNAASDFKLSNKVKLEEWRTQESKLVNSDHI